jgi:hypothetical protein
MSHTECMASGPCTRPHRISRQSCAVLDSLARPANFVVSIGFVGRGRVVCCCCVGGLGAQPYTVLLMAVAGLLADWVQVRPARPLVVGAPLRRMPSFLDCEHLHRQARLLCEWRGSRLGSTLQLLNGIVLHIAL